jgi:hypothetical protein
MNEMNEINLPFPLALFLSQQQIFIYRKKIKKSLFGDEHTLRGTDDKVLLLDYDSEFCYFLSLIKCASQNSRLWTCVFLGILRIFRHFGSKDAKIWIKRCKI